MNQFAIIADDLSSATDCGAQVVRSGLSVVVPLESYSLPQMVESVQVISVDTDSRSLSASQAYSKVKIAAQHLMSEGWTRFYKSVDSTLRGNLGAEIEALMDVVNADCAIVAPAFPKYGRTTVDGVQYLHGRPLHDTEFGTDPTAPVKNADISLLVGNGSHRKSGRLTLQDVHAGRVHIENTVQGLLADGIELVIVDISEQDDLKRISLGLAKSDLRTVWVGSTGLAEFVPLAFGADTIANDFNSKFSLDPRPALALVGSASETTRQQLLHAKTSSGLVIVEIDAVAIIQDSKNTSSELEQAYVKLCLDLDAGRDVAIVVKSSREEIARTQQIGATLNLDPTQVAQQIVDALARIGGRLVREDRVSGVVATGGDTANALCKNLKSNALKILGEVEAGIPIMKLLGEKTLPLVTKAGGFGTPSAIGEALTKVKQYG